MNLYYIAFTAYGSPKLASFFVEKEDDHRLYVKIDSICFILSRFYISRIIDKKDKKYFITSSKTEALNWLQSRGQEKLAEWEEEVSRLKGEMAAVAQMIEEEANG